MIKDYFLRFLLESYEKVETILGKLDIVVNNAGILTEVNWKKMIDVNLVNNARILLKMNLISWSTTAENIFNCHEACFELFNIDNTHYLAHIYILKKEPTSIVVFIE